MPSAVGKKAHFAVKIRQFSTFFCNLAARKRLFSPINHAFAQVLDSSRSAVRNLPIPYLTQHEQLSAGCIFPGASSVYPVSMNATAYCSMNAMESEASVIARGLRRRDPDLMDRLIEQHQHRLLRYLVYLCGNRALAEDLFQETWIRVIERGHQYDGRHEFSTWLYTVARNLTIDYLRKKNPVSLDGLMENEEHAPFEPVDRRPAAWQVMAQHEQAERIGAALVGIPAEYREAIVLRFQDELSLDEIASVTKAPLGTVKSRLYRGLNMLMERLEGRQA